MLATFAIAKERDKRRVVIIESFKEHAIFTTYFACLMLRRTLQVIRYRLKTTFKLIGTTSPIEVSTILAVILHDIGKVCEAYQSRVRDVVSGKLQVASFYGHEIYSSAILFRLLCKVFNDAYNDRELARNLAAIFSLAVLRHHQAMRSIEDIANSRNGNIPDKWSVCEKTIYYICNATEQALELSADILKVDVLKHYLDMRIDKYLVEILKDCYDYRTCINVIKEEVLGSMTRAGGKITLYSILSGIIILADRIAAKIVRGDFKFSRLDREYIETIKLDLYKF